MRILRAFLLALFPSVALADNWTVGAAAYFLLSIAIWPLALIHVILVLIFVKLKKYESRKFAMTHTILACIPGAWLAIPGILGLNPANLIMPALFIGLGCLPIHIHNNYFRKRV